MSLHVICGPMRSGKTAELIRLVRQARAYGREARVFVHELGVNRNGHILFSSSGKSIGAKPVRSLDEVYGADVLAVDEAHFWDQFQVRRLAELSRDHEVIVAGLDTSFRGEPFDGMAYLLAMADSVTKLAAVCARCGEPATRTQRLIEGKPAPWGSPVILPGGDDVYEPRCVECHEVPGRPEVSAV